MSYRDGPLRVRSTDPELFTPVDLDEQLLALVQSVVMSFNMSTRDISLGFSQLTRQVRLSNASLTLAPRPVISPLLAPGGNS